MAKTGVLAAHSVLICFSVSGWAVRFARKWNKGQAYLLGHSLVLEAVFSHVSPGLSAMTQQSYVKMSHVSKMTYFSQRCPFQEKHHGIRGKNGPQPYLLLFWLMCEAWPSHSIPQKI